jgi:hypothetical protein
MIGVQKGCTRVSLARFFPPRTRFPPLRGAAPALRSQETPDRRVNRRSGAPCTSSPHPPTLWRIRDFVLSRRIAG